MYTSKEMIVKLISCVVILQILFNGCSACDADLQECIDNILSRAGHTNFYSTFNANIIDDIVDMRNLQCNPQNSENPFKNQKMSDFDVSSIQDFSHCFNSLLKSYRTYVIHYDLNSWDVSKGTNFYRMFYYVGSGLLEMNHYSSLSNSEHLLQVANWNVSSGTDFRQMFQNGDFPSLNLNNWHISNTAFVNNMLPKYSDALTRTNLALWFNGDELTQRRIFDQMPANCGVNFFSHDYDSLANNIVRTRSCYYMCPQSSQYYIPTRFSCPYPNLRSNAIFFGTSDERKDECCDNPCDYFNTSSQLNGTRIEYKVGDDCHYADVSVIGVAKTMIENGDIVLNNECELQS